jgi:hypothetical protein
MADQWRDDQRHTQPAKPTGEIINNQRQKHVQQAPPNFPSPSRHVRFRNPPHAGDRFTAKRALPRVAPHGLPAERTLPFSHIRNCLHRGSHSCLANSRCWPDSQPSLYLFGSPHKRLLCLLYPASHLSTQSFSFLLAKNSPLPYIFLPNLWILCNIVRQHADARFLVQIHHFDSVFPQPVDSPAKAPRFPHDYRADPKLPDQSAAIPARRQCRYHDLVAVSSLSARFPECIRFRVSRRIALLHPPVMSSSQNPSLTIKKGCPNRYPALAPPRFRFFDCHLQHLRITQSSHHSLPRALAL